MSSDPVHQLPLEVLDGPLSPEALATLAFFIGKDPIKSDAGQASVNFAAV